MQVCSTLYLATPVFAYASGVFKSQIFLSGLYLVTNSLIKIPGQPRGYLFHHFWVNADAAECAASIARVVVPGQK